MRLSNAAGESFELTIAGYQFPHLDNSAYPTDRNWLNITVHANHARQGRWSVTDPCLMTWDVLRMIAWFETILAGEPDRDHLGFIEPNLSFEISSGNPLTLRITFDLEMHPNWRDGDDVWLDFDLMPDVITAIIDSLTAQLERFPPRDD